MSGPQNLVPPAESPPRVRDELGPSADSLKEKGAGLSLPEPSVGPTKDTGHLSTQLFLRLTLQCPSGALERK